MSSNGDGELVLQKWCSIFNPDANVHEGHGPSFPKCEHGNSEDRDWIGQGILKKIHAQYFLFLRTNMYNI